MKPIAHRSPGTAILGSSNFTVPGTLTSRELNSEFTQAEAVKELQEWFDNLWDNHSEEFREDLIKLLKYSNVFKKDEKNPFGKYLPPNVLFKYLSWIWLRGNIEPIEKEDILAQFQLIGVLNAIEMISQYHGCIVADSVGLGKSFIGAALIEEYINAKIPSWIPDYEDYDGIRRVLLILPPTLIKQWRELLFDDEDREFFTKNIIKDISKSDKFVEYQIFGKGSSSPRIIGEITIFSLGKFQNMEIEEVYNKKFNSKYDLILIDEAHKFRNNWTKRYKNLRVLRYKKKNNPNSHKNKFILLTATPINNNIWDIYNLIKIFSDDHFIEFKKRNVDFSSLFSEYKEIKKKWLENRKEEGNLKIKAEEIKEKIFKRVILLRTRRYIMETFGKDGKITIRGKEYSVKDPIPDKIVYEKKSKRFDSYNDFLKTIESNFEDLEFVFTKFYSSGFVAITSSESREDGDKAEKIMIPINAILEFLLAKRLESSIFAFERTLVKLDMKNNFYLNSLLAFLEKNKDSTNEEFLLSLEHYCKNILQIAGKDVKFKEFDEDDIDIEERKIDPQLRIIYNIINNVESNLSVELMEKMNNKKIFYEFIGNNPKIQEIILLIKEGFNHFISDLKKDKEIFQIIKESLRNVKVLNGGIVDSLGTFRDSGNEVNIPKYNDPKIEKLKEIIYNDLLNKKFIIFTQYKDTAEYLYHFLNKWILSNKKTLSYLFKEDGIKLEMVSGDNDMKSKERIIERFAPIANNAKKYLDNNEDITILVSTETLSEGVNLQDGDGVVNFDLPWNPMKIIQRIGRISRIGNEKPVFVKNFSPTRELEAIIGILEKLNSKIKDITFLVGKEFYILSEDEEISPETFEKKIKNLADAKLSQLEDISKIGDSKFFYDIDYKEEIARFKLLNFIQEELKLRKDDYEEIEKLDKKKSYYTLTDSNILFRVYEVFRGKSSIGRFIIKLDGKEITESTCEDFIRLWNIDETLEDIDIEDLKNKTTILDNYFKTVIFENFKGETVQSGVVGKIFDELRNLKAFKRIKELKIDEKKTSELIDYLYFVEMNTHQIKELTDYLKDSGCISKTKQMRILDYPLLIEKIYDFFDISGDTIRKLDYGILGWWV